MKGDVVYRREVWQGERPVKAVVWSVYWQWELLDRVFEDAPGMSWQAMAKLLYEKRGIIAIDVADDGNTAAILGRYECQGNEKPEPRPSLFDRVWEWWDRCSLWLVGK
jgi:hypothetical protein